MKATLKFYDDTKNVILPDNFEKFLVNLSEMLEVPQEFLDKIKLFYKDDEDDKIMLKTSSDYIQFLTQLKNNDVSMIEIILNDEKDNEFKNKISESFIKYSSNDILNKSNSLDIKNEIENNNINNNIKPIISNIDKNNIPKKKEESNNEVKPQLVQPNSIINNNNINEKDKTNDQNINNYKNDSLNNINTLLNNNNQIIQNINNINDNMKKTNTYNNQNIQINNHNQNIQNSNNIEKNNKTIFKVACTACSKNPIYLKVYKCQECNMFFCKECEKKYGPEHIHPLLKIRTNEQLEQWKNIKLKDKSKNKKANKIFENVKEKVIDNIKKVGDYLSIYNNNDKQNNENKKLISNNNNFNNNNNYPNNHIQNNNNIPYNQQITNQISNYPNNRHHHHNNPNYNILELIKNARKSYDLHNIKDEELKIALIKANYNIENAVIMLVNNTK